MAGSAADDAAENLAARLESAVDAIERSLQRARRSMAEAAGDFSDESRATIGREWAALREDLNDLMNRADVSASPEIRALVDRLRGTLGSVSDSLADVASEARLRAREGAERVGEYAQASPWQAAGIAAIAGFLVGVLIARK